MIDPEKKPLDYQEVVDEEKAASTISPTQRLLQNLEFLPLILLAMGLTMRNFGMSNSQLLLSAGGLSSAVLYGLFSWYMFKVEKYRPLEVILSILCGLVFPVGILGVLFRYESWPYGEELIDGAMYGGLTLLFVSILLFVFHLKDKRASLFYRNLIARLLIFSVLLLNFRNLF